MMTEDGEDGPGSAAAESRGELTCRGRHRKRSGCWSRFSSTVLCIRRKEVRESLENPSEGALQTPENVSLTDREEDTKTKKTRTVLGRLRTLDVQLARSQSRGGKAPQNFQKKLQKFFIRGEKCRSEPLGNLEDMQVQEDVSKLPLDREADESLEAVTVPAELNVQLMEGQAAEGPEPPGEVLTNTEPEPVQTVDINQVSVEVVSLEDDEVFVDLHDGLQSEVHPEGTTRTSQSSKPSTNGPAIRIQVCPPQEEDWDGASPQEEDWDGASPSENHLHLLFGSDHSELQLLQTARSLVRTAVRAAVDQLSREQQNHEVKGQRMNFLFPAD